MTELEQRAAVVQEALEWVRTPFVWEASIKGVGVDCGRFLAAVFNNAGVRQIDLAALPHLSPQWFLHHADESYLNVIRQFAEEYTLQPGEVPPPGDIVVAKYGRDWAHSAIVIEWPKVIGAAHGTCVTVWNNLFRSPQYATRELRYFTAFGRKQ